MGITGAYQEFRDLVFEAKNLTALGHALSRIAQALECDYYAVGHHVDWGRRTPNAFRLQNYPARWVEFYDRSGFGGRDPVHRASARTQSGFLWREAGHLIDFTASDARLMALAMRHGIADGFTVPANVPGEFQGSCTFATAPDNPLTEERVMLARLIAPHIFEAGRRLVGNGQLIRNARTARLTHRQRTCLLWIAAGKSDWETGQILGISEGTVRQHISDSCKRLGIQKRTLLLFLAFRNGAISFPEVPFH
ncbi:LuxR family transcriptional regulator [Novosphingobium sp. Rr 2-17]|uniref:LuxR family transcriptional regulator n=1 Tax=Novosphingobium sp. Rr 2-17 TaxID=555793 RepID=UPI0002698BEF|nr:autoinducer binding domain-containing protein [Novosphingobium sp. Rr 2-17]EIZ78125.1 LuxR family transcriptional regulator [Novosphingobium sp. Rr 2-17]